MAGEWTQTAQSLSVVDPMNGEPFLAVPDTQLDEIQPFIDSLRSVPKSGLHNPLKLPERWEQGARGHGDRVGGLELAWYVQR